MNIRVSKEFLIQEWENAVSGVRTADCRRGPCNDCGVCDFKTLKPVVYEPCDLPIAASGVTDITPETAYRKLDVSYAKLEDARFLGHLEMVNIFLRALRRANIPIKYSEGYHPMPRVSFEDPLPLGTESMEEHFYLTVPTRVAPEMVVDGLTEHLPGGLVVRGCRIIAPKEKRRTSEPVSYAVEIKDGVFEENAVRYFDNLDHLLFKRKDKKGRQRAIDLKEVVLQLDIQHAGTLKMTLVNEPGKRVRPVEIIKQIFHLPDEDLRQARIIKLVAASQGDV